MMTRNIVLVIAMMAVFVLIIGCTETSLPSTSIETEQINKPIEAQPTEEKITITSTELPATVATIEPAPVSDTQDSISKIILQSFIQLDPLFGAYTDDLITNDYEGLAKDSLTLRKEVMRQQKYFGDSLASSKIEGASKFSSKDKILYQKYIGYLDILNGMIKSNELALLLINDKDLELSVMDKLELLNPALNDKERAYDQVETIFDTCEEFGDECGRDDPRVEQLTRRDF